MTSLSNIVGEIMHRFGDKEELPEIQTCNLIQELMIERIRRLEDDKNLPKHCAHHPV